MDKVKILNEFTGTVRRAVDDYNMIQAGDKVAVGVSGGKDSMLLAKLVQLLQRCSDVPFQARYLVMDPGYSPANRRRIEENAARLRLPVEVSETDIFGEKDMEELKTLTDPATQQI